MTDLLQSIKDDLTDRRLRPLVAGVLFVLVAAIGYALLSGGSSSSTTTTAVVIRHAVPGSTGLAVSQAETTAGQALAETTNGISTQRKGAAHDPFAPLPGSSTSKSTSAVAAVSKSPAAATSAAPASSSGKGATETSGSTSTPSSPAKPSAPAKPKTVYKVALQFGQLPAGTVPQSAELPAYVGLTKPRPLPSSKNKLVEFLGVTVTSGGQHKSASFALEGEVIIHGPGTCLPSVAQCSMIDLTEGQSEQLEYLSATGQPITYGLRVVSIASTSATSAAFESIVRAQSKSAGGPAGSAGLLSQTGMRYSTRSGALVFVGHPAFGA